MAVASYEWGRVLPAAKSAKVGWGMLEVFLIILYLSSALLFLPGAQAVRGVIRGLPYAASLLLLAIRFGEAKEQWKELPGRWWVLFSLFFMGGGLLHAEANFFAGLGQIALQVSIVGPLFWVASDRISPRRLERLLWLVFLFNAASGVVGLLQFFYPEQFMPPELSSMLTKDEAYMSSLTFTDATGRTIVRPPGLTDLPGGSGGAAAIAAVFGMLMAANPGIRLPRRLLCAALSAAGLVSLYLTLCRSMLMSVVLVLFVACLLLLRQNRTQQSITLGAIGGAIVVGGFLVAVTLGGDQVFDRYFSVLETGVVTSYSNQRGIFLEQTLKQLLGEYPFGAGIGRWGMMGHYFGRFDSNPSPPVWVEIQLTGWLVDGGIPLMVTYMGAILVVLFGLYRLTIPERGGVISYPALMALCAAAFLVVQSSAGPTFNATSGMQLWLLAALVFSADKYCRSTPAPARGFQETR
jgi:hypothetical protein